ncbi:tetratricopeptide repeat protein [Acaryochloris marina]|uniref:Transcriptional regulator, LuxR family with TPR repeats n=1 Tax=Acaryochloris marina (strain MBIC 11017) TaxID=329726 RepID=B0C3T1_ACAM1|nr:tetratricopeptide repeat protein [Acaryochloris marina]ABW31018.1 transcriptional regulator, LuxR family with TPR repeats [Acaryochloris marina MBIC11017]BDM79739.1 LuxR family transcriptional regulator [Acaryochloris marina MBIC10699]
MVDVPGQEIAEIPLLETKLYRPKWRPGLVSRPRLLERIHKERKLTLVSAPAGFGKTTLLAEWVAAVPDQLVTWVSLDQGDNDSAFFWAYLITALQKINSGLGERSLSLLQSPQPPPIESVLAILINEINGVEDNLTLILDDFHVIENRGVQEAITFLLDHLPFQLHLIIASRTDPPLPLARLRGRGELTELRAADLRFTSNEAAAFLNRMMGLDISPADIAALETRTEGWVAGLQLAALSMQGREDIPEFIAAFSGDDRYIVDYLLEEVLQRQCDRVRTFLLQTAMLERLSGPLCDAVTNQQGSQTMLADLERDNLFVVPLDNKRQWYRYHHLFADVLQAHAIAEQLEHLSILHRRASEWYEQNNQLFHAIHHALAAKDFERAASLIERIWPTMRQRQQESTVFGWMKSLPNSVFHNRPVLSVVYALVLLNDGQLDTAEARLQNAERWLDKDTESPAVERVVVDDLQFRSLPASIANARAYRAQALGDVSSTITYAQQALALLPEDAAYERGTTASLLGLAYWASGNLEAAHLSFAKGLAIFQKIGGVQIAIGGTLILAHIRRGQGRLQEAIRTCEQALQLATEQGEPGRRGTAELLMALSELHYEQGDLETASQLLLQGEELREQATTLPGADHLWCVVQAHLKESLGDLEEAFKLLNEAERSYHRIPIPDVRPVAALKVRMWVRQGQLSEALSWANERQLSVEDDLSYLKEYEHITLTRVLIARYRSDGQRSAQGHCRDNVIHQVLDLLARLLQVAQAAGRNGSVLDILVTQGLAYEVLGDVERAISPLKCALTLAEPEGYVRIFAQEGTSMAELLREIAARGITPGYTGRLLTALETWGQKREDQAVSPISASAQSLVEPLSQRELDVLRLLRTDLSGPEIARELVVALSTVRTHTKSIYSKLNVNNRRAAIKRATALDLI